MQHNQPNLAIVTGAQHMRGQQQLRIEQSHHRGCLHILAGEHDGDAAQSKHSRTRLKDVSHPFFFDDRELSNGSRQIPADLRDSKPQCQQARDPCSKKPHAPSDLVLLLRRYDTIHDGGRRIRLRFSDV